MKQFTLRALALAALVLPASALAQSGGARAPDDGTTPIPEIAWEEDFAGLYAENGACEDADAVWAFAPDTVEMGRTICTWLGKLTWQDGWLIVPASQCSRMGESRDSISLALRADGDGSTSARFAESDTVTRLERCPHPGDPTAP